MEINCHSPYAYMSITKAKETIGGVFGSLSAHFCVHKHCLIICWHQLTLKIGFSVESGRNAVLVYSLNRHFHIKSLYNNEVLWLEINVFIVSMCYKWITLFFLVSAVKETEERLILLFHLKNKTCWPNFQAKIRKFCRVFCPTIRIILRIERPEMTFPFKGMRCAESMQCNTRFWKINHAKTWPISWRTHCIFSFCFFCITVRDLYDEINACGVQSDATSAKVQWNESKDAKMQITKSVHLERYIERSNTEVHFEFVKLHTEFQLLSMYLVSLVHVESEIFLRLKKPLN